MIPSTAESNRAASPPAEPFGKLFLRFLRFGLVAWGGPVAQIDMIRHELVEQEKWISPAHFKRLLAIYQVLPGPEAHEMCVHLGMLARGRWGGVLAGLGFMLPGFCLIFLLSWLYVSLDFRATAFQAVFLGLQPAVIALMVRATHRIGGHCLTDPALWVIAALAAGAELLGVSFWVALVCGGIGYSVALRKNGWACAVMIAVFAVSVWQFSPVITKARAAVDGRPAMSMQTLKLTTTVAPGELFVSGLRAGLLTFGGAYTAIPFLRHDAVERGQWMSEREFLDGVALSGVLPAPLIIFSTFVGYLGGGAIGACAITLGIFLPAFGFSLLFHRHLEAVMAHPTLKHFLDGVTASVVGLIAVTTIGLARAAIPSAVAAGLMVAALFVLYRWKSKFAIPAVMIGAGAVGGVFF